jgi:hypothetical protein
MDQRLGAAEALIPRSCVFTVSSAIRRPISCAAMVEKR